MKSELQIIKDIELYETLLHRAAADFIDASNLGDFDLSMRYMVDAVTIVHRLENLQPQSKINKLWSSAWKGATKL